MNLHERFASFSAIQEEEKYWIALQPFLLGKGYKLRPRYDPAWQPPWLRKKDENWVSALATEEALEIPDDVTLDAIRVQDGQKVVLKKVPTNSDEIRLAVLLSSEPMKKDPRNCCVPILDVLLTPGDDEYALLVMPFLAHVDLLPFRFLGEFCEFLLQVLEGLEFLHEHNIAHKDIGPLNIMMDVTRMVPKGIHFAAPETHDGISSEFKWNTRWSVRPVQYYIIDFGLSQQYPNKENALTVGICGQDTTAPELSTEVPYNPFSLDIYVLGIVFREFIRRYDGLDIFSGLVNNMTKEGPKERPSATEAVAISREVVEQVKKRQTHLDEDRPIKLSTIWKLAIRCGYNPPV